MGVGVVTAVRCVLSRIGHFQNWKGRADGKGWMQEVERRESPVEGNTSEGSSSRKREPK